MQDHKPTNQHGLTSLPELPWLVLFLIKLNSRCSNRTFIKKSTNHGNSGRAGFTLIELMIVITIIGILAIFAIPAYQDYTSRARVMEGLHLATAAKLAVEEEVMLNHTFPLDQDSIGYVSPISTRNVKTINIADRTGVITITYTELLGLGTIMLIPSIQDSGEVRWICQSDTMKKLYLTACM